MCNPPQPGDPSYEQYAAECKGVLESLGRKARALSEGFNKFKNMQCNEVEGKEAESDCAPSGLKLDSLQRCTKTF